MKNLADLADLAVLADKCPTMAFSTEYILSILYSTGTEWRLCDILKLPNCCHCSLAFIDKLKYCLYPFQMQILQRRLSDFSSISQLLYNLEDTVDVRAGHSRQLGGAFSLIFNFQRCYFREIQTNFVKTLRFAKFLNAVQQPKHDCNDILLIRNLKNNPLANKWHIYAVKNEKITLHLFVGQFLQLRPTFLLSGEKTELINLVLWRFSNNICYCT